MEPKIAHDLEPSQQSYLVGAGIYDITGPAAEVVMMGFAVPEQKTSGIHMRLRSRAFIIGDDAKRVVFVSVDLGMVFQQVKLGVARKLRADPELSPYYDEKNVLLSATHTHGGPGGYSGYFLYDVTIGGFIKKHYEIIVEGIYRSIQRAHRNLCPGTITIARGTLQGVGGNRATEPYANNPAEERALYDGDVDRSFTLLKLVSSDGKELGMINWFALHPDSVGPGNTLITGDNKGLASYLFERDHGTDYRAESTFVAAFAQANAGDVTPNIGFGQAPPEVDLDRNPSLEHAALEQYEMAKTLYASAMEPLTGSVDYRHEWVDMQSLYVESARAPTAAAGMGASFSAGSPFDNDSPVALFDNGTTVASLTLRHNPFGTLLMAFFRLLFAPFWRTTTRSYRASHAEKPVLLPTGLTFLNLHGTPMTPRIMPLQILKIGSLVIVAAPTEVTTMAGRRFKRAALEELEAVGVRHAVVSTLANSYASYLATREEYAKQWYEGAATLFGPHQEAGFRQEYRKLCRAIVRGTPVPEGPVPPDVTEKTVDFTVKPRLDRVPRGKHFGDLIAAPHSHYRVGDVVEVGFWGGHPNHDYRIQDSYLVVEREQEGRFVPVAHDWDPETTFRWRRRGIYCSEISIRWDTRDALPGHYRIRHLGHAKSWSGRLRPYEGVTPSFELNRVD